MVQEYLNATSISVPPSCAFCARAQIQLEVKTTLSTKWKDVLPHLIILLRASAEHFQGQGVKKLNSGTLEAVILQAFKYADSGLSRILVL